MKVILSVLALVTALVYSPQMTRAQQIVEAKPGSELFEQFRPVFHFMAREKWMNDPCSPYYDQETGLYHMFYQLNPNSTIWGNMTYGHAVSKDQVTWTDYPNALYPFENKWDNLGVFSGFSMANAIDGKQTLFYTGVTALPINWKLPYLFGEHVVYATTDDAGKTWQKGSEPLIELPPKGLNVTGWRDPMPFHSKKMDTMFGYNSSQGSNYLIVAGGLHGVGPRIFLYHSPDYLNWDFMGYLLAPEKNTTFSPYSESWGFNFEMTIYREMTDDEGVLHSVMIFAAENSPNRYPMWATGSLTGQGCGFGSNREAGLFDPLMVGVADRSDWYANSIYTDSFGRDILIGWITESNGFTNGQPQGWDGILSLPREISITIVRDIDDVDNHLVGKGDWIVSEVKNMSCADGCSKQSKTIKTLGVKPISDLSKLRNQNEYEQVRGVSLNCSSHVLNSTGTSFEMIAEVSDFERGSVIGIEVRRSSAKDEVTTIVYDDSEKKVMIDRSASSTADCAVFEDHDVKPKSEAVWGHFYLYDLFSAASQSEMCESSRERLTFHVFVDVSSVEVFVNDRFALSARIYPCAQQTKSDGIALTASGSAKFDRVHVWTDSKHAWPETRMVPTF